MFIYSWSCAEGAASEESGKESCVIEPAIESLIDGGSITQHKYTLQRERERTYLCLFHISDHKQKSTSICWLLMVIVRNVSIGMNCHAYLFGMGFSHSKRLKVAVCFLFQRIKITNDLSCQCNLRKIHNSSSVPASFCKWEPHPVSCLIVDNDRTQQLNHQNHQHSFREKPPYLKSCQYFSKVSVISIYHWQKHW